jgi:hypothetical protein
MYEIKINGVAYDFSYEYPITYTLDRTLDFGSINIPLINRKEVFPMYSLVEITRDNNFVEYFLVSGDIVKLSSYNPVLYSHTIQLVEYTKKLENYLISAASFTQPTDGSIRYNYYDVLDRLVKISVFETSSRETAALPCVLDNSLLPLQDLVSPEFFFYNRTLREALDEVLSTLPGIARLKRVNNIDTLFIDYLDATHAVITEDIGLTYDGEQNIANYATTLISDVSNAVRGTKGTESVTVIPNDGGWAVLTTPEGVGIIDDTLSVMDLKQGIYDIVKLEIQAEIQFGVIVNSTNEQTTIQRKVELDLSRFVVTKEQYEALRGSWINGPNGRFDIPFDDLPPNITQQQMIEQGLLNKQNAIWFEPGTNFIQGLTTDWRGTFLTPETERRRSLENAILTAFNKQSIIDEGIYKKVYRVEIGRNVNAVLPENRERWELLMFRAVFIPQEISNRVAVERLDLTNFSKEAFAYFKQNANLINLNAYINKMDGDLQRTGEEAYVANVIISSYGDLLTLGDTTTDGYVLMSTTVIQHLDYLEVAYNFSRNYQQINEMIAIDKANDFFELVSGDKVLDRFLLYRDFMVLSDANTNISADTTLLTVDGNFSYLGTFVNNLSPLLVESWNMIRFSNVKLFAPVAGSGSGSSLVLTAGFNHNAIAGNTVSLNLEDGGYVQIPAFYALDGELDDFDVEFYDSFNNPYGIFRGFFSSLAALEAAFPNPQSFQYAGVGGDLNKKTSTAYTGSAGIWVNMNKTVEEYEFDLDLAFARALPLVDRTDYNVYITNKDKGIGSFKVYKDPGERLKFNYQIQAIVAPNNIGQIIIGSYFSNYNGLVHTPKETLRIHFSTDTYGKGDIQKAKINPAEPNGVFLVSSLSAGNILNIGNVIPQNANSYGVSDSSGRLLFAVNRVDGVLLNSLKLTFTHTRPGLNKL